MLEETPAQWVAHLSHPNGWWRDTAQRLLVQEQDKTVVPALDTIVSQSDNHLAKIHALWTLQGLGGLNETTLTAARTDPHPKVARTGELLSQPLPTYIEKEMESNLSNLGEAEKRQYAIGKTVYEQTCFGCHQPNGRGIAKVAPTIAGSDWVDRDDATLARILLHGLEGLIREWQNPGRHQGGHPGHATFLSDEQIAVSTYIRNTGQHGSWHGSQGRAAGPSRDQIVTRGPRRSWMRWRSGVAPACSGPIKQ